MISTHTFNGLGLEGVTSLRLSREIDGLEVVVVPEDPESHWVALTLGDLHTDLTEFPLSALDLERVIAALLATRYSLRKRRLRRDRFVLDVETGTFRFTVPMKGPPPSRARS